MTSVRVCVCVYCDDRIRFRQIVNGVASSEMFTKKANIDLKKSTQKIQDSKKDSAARLRHLKTILEHVDSDEAKNLFEANYSHVYYILYDTFVQAEANLKQRGKCCSFPGPGLHDHHTPSSSAILTEAQHPRVATPNLELSTYKRSISCGISNPTLLP